MQKRLGIGFLKGSVLGALVGVGVLLGLRWPTPSGGVLAFLLAMGVGGTAGVFGGRAPWKEGAWLEALLKMIFGVGTGALLYWLASRYAAIEIPFVGGPQRWTAIAPFYLVPIGALYGAIVELDYDGSAEPAKKKTSAAAASASKTLGDSPKVRVPAGEVEDAEIVESARPPRRK